MTDRTVYLTPTRNSDPPLRSRLKVYQKTLWWSRPSNGVASNHLHFKVRGVSRKKSVLVSKKEEKTKRDITNRPHLNNNKFSNRQKVIKTISLIRKERKTNKQNPIKTDTVNYKDPEVGEIIGQTLYLLFFSGSFE